MIEIWVILRRKHKIVHDALAPYNDMRPTEVALPESLNDICRAWDIPRPMILKRHVHDFDTFGRVIFKPDQFVEAFPYDALEVEAIVERAEQQQLGD